MEPWRGNLPPSIQIILAQQDQFCPLAIQNIQNCFTHNQSQRLESGGCEAKKLFFWKAGGVGYQSGNNVNLKLKLNLMNPILTVLHSCLYLWQLCVQWKRLELQEPSIVIYWMLHHQPGLRICAAQNWLQKAKERQKCKTNWSLIPGAEKSYLSINNQCFLRPPVLSRYFTWTGSIQ